MENEVHDQFLFHEVVQRGIHGAVVDLFSDVHSGSSFLALEPICKVPSQRKKQQSCFQQSREKPDGFMEYAQTFQRINEEAARLKEQRKCLLDQQQSDSAANGRIAHAEKSSKAAALFSAMEVSYAAQSGNLL